ncbi:MAG TPA: hypothetical protein VKH37_06845, partial [Ferruginibacter sp.]|nr:hypothetical protein [Ferruginibacter sp.]
TTTIAKEDAIVITISADSKIYLIIGGNAHRDAIFNNINKDRSLGLSDADMQQLRKMDYIGFPLDKLRQALELGTATTKFNGIPADSSNNELSYWIKAVVESVPKDEMNILVKNNSSNDFKTFKKVANALKQNDIYKFKIVTEPADQQ